MAFSLPVLSWFKRGASNTRVARPRLDGFSDIYGREVEDAELIMYPPKHVGIPVFSLAAIKKRYKSHIDAVIHHGGMGDNRLAEDGRLLRDALYHDVIDRFIEYTHMVPASEGYHHDKPGGLLVHCLEVATMAIRISKEERPSQESKYIDIQRDVEKRMPYAAFIGGLLHDTGKLFTDMRISALFVLSEKPDGSAEDVSVVENDLPIPDWRPERESLIAWAQRFSVTRYTVTYLPARIHKRHNAKSSHLLPALLNKESLDYILACQVNIHGVLIDALNGYSDAEDYLSSVIRKADSRSTAEDAIRIHSAYTGTSQLSAFQKIHKLIRIAYPSWSFNKQKGHAWCIGGSVFLSWTQAFDSIIDASRKSKIFIPRSAEFLYELMLENSIVKPFAGKDRSIKFIPGQFRDKDVILIHKGETTPVWHHLIELRDWATFFEGDALPKGSPGIIHSPKTGDYLLISKSGEFKTFKVDELNALNAQTQPVESKPAESESQSKEDAKTASDNRPARVSKDKQPAATKALASSGETNRAVRKDEKQAGNAPARKANTEPGKSIPKVKSKIDPAMIAKLGIQTVPENAEPKSADSNDKPAPKPQAQSGNSKVDDKTSGQKGDSTPNEPTTPKSGKPTSAPTTETESDDSNTEDGASKAYELLPTDLSILKTKHAGLKGIDAKSLGEHLDMRAADAIEHLRELGLKVEEVPNRPGQLVELIKSKAGAQLMAYVSEETADRIQQWTNTPPETSTPKKSASKQQAQTKPETATPKPDAPAAISSGKHSRSEENGAEVSEVTQDVPETDQSPTEGSHDHHMPTEAPTLGEKAQAETEKDKGEPEPVSQLPVSSSTTTTVLHYCQAAPRGSLAAYMVELNKRNPKYDFIFEGDINAVGFDREFTRALVDSGLASSASAVGSIPFIVFEHYTDESDENSVYWYKAPIIYVHVSVLSEIQLGELK